MAFLIIPTTELEAVNECLENIGESPVSTLSGDLGVDAQIALNFVRKVNRALQSRGWYWNTEKDYPLTPNGDSDILLPFNTLSVDTTAEDADRDLVQRGPRLYDRDNRTYAFTTSVKVQLVLGLTFEELPETARRYISLRAARLFQDRVEGGANGEDSQDEMDALSVLHADQLRVEDNNALTGSYGIFKTLNRTGY
jgi:hypothetical protein